MKYLFILETYEKRSMQLFSFVLSYGSFLLETISIIGDSKELSVRIVPKNSYI